MLRNSLKVLRNTHPPLEGVLRNCYDKCYNGSRLMKKEGVIITEENLREQVRDLCKLFGWKFHFSWTGIHSPRGMPDLILVKPPRIIFAELKTEKGKVSTYQREWLDILDECPGCEIYLWRSGDIEDIARILQGKVRDDGVSV